MKAFNIYMIGVGGQGIGMLSEILMRASDHAGHQTIGVDTHGLAQRGGVVTSHLRLGEGVYTPLISQGEADLVVGLERHEALRGINGYLKHGGTLIYYNTVWQPLEVRLHIAEEVDEETISRQCRLNEAREIRVFSPHLKEARMQNIVVLAAIDKHALIPGVAADHYRQAMTDLMDGDTLKKNLTLFEKEGLVSNNS